MNGRNEAASLARKGSAGCALTQTWPCGESQFWQPGGEQGATSPPGTLCRPSTQTPLHAHNWHVLAQRLRVTQETRRHTCSRAAPRGVYTSRAGWRAGEATPAQTHPTGDRRQLPRPQHRVWEPRSDSGYTAVPTPLCDPGHGA